MKKKMRIKMRMEKNSLRPSVVHTSELQEGERREDKERNAKGRTG